VWNYAGTRTAGNLLAVGDGGTWTQKWAVGYDGRTTTTRVVAAPDTPASASNAVTFDLSRSQNIEHSVTEDTTVTITGGSVGQRGTFVFSQDGSGHTVTMPSASSTIIYSEALNTLGTTAMVNASASVRTIMHYYIHTGGKVMIHGREVLAT
jgi:hypothetical protein